MQTGMVTQISRKPPDQECHLDICGYQYPSLPVQLVIRIQCGALTRFLVGLGGIELTLSTNSAQDNPAKLEAVNAAKKLTLGLVLLTFT